MALFYTGPTTFIYALIDPRNGMLRYVGKANDPKKRLRKHLREAAIFPRCHRNCWLKGLLDAGQKPDLFLVEEVPEVDW
jgi:hypothetical protein